MTLTPVAEANLTDLWLAAEGIAVSGELVRSGRRSLYVWLAWASPCAGVVLAAAFWAVAANEHGMRGERPSGVLLCYVAIAAAGAAGALAGAVSLFGVRSWRDALVIIPGAITAVAFNTSLTFMALYAYALVGRNLGG